MMKMNFIALSRNVNQILTRNCYLSYAYIQFAPYSCGGTHNLAAYKRGNGGRGSFNGYVATVFGCTGFLGRYVCNKLGKIGTQMILPYRSDFYDAARLKVAGDLGQVLFTSFDIRDDDSIRKAVQHSNVVINLIGRDYETKNFSYYNVHVDGPRRIARIACECGVDRFIHVSYLNACEKPEPLFLKKRSMYKITKYYGEGAVREEFPTATVFRASDMYGSEDRFLRTFASWWRINSKFLPLWANGLKTCKMPVFVSDVAQGIINAMLNPATKCVTYQAIGPKKYLLADLVDWIFAVMRKDEKWGFKRYDLKYDVTFPLKLEIIKWISPGYPWGGVHAEAIEKEATTDIYQNTMPTLVDLCVNLTHMEDQVPWELRPWRAYQYYLDQIGEFPVPPPPRSKPFWEP